MALATQAGKLPRHGPTDSGSLEVGVAAVTGLLDSVYYNATKACSCGFRESESDDSEGA